MSLLGKKIEISNFEEGEINEKPQKEKCQICKLNEYKYTCPKCFYKTCSVQCVKSHKKRFGCDGQRDKFKKVYNQNDYNEKVFFRDMKFLSNTINDVNSTNRKIFNLTEELYSKKQNKMNKNFKRILKKFREINYYKCPLIMSCNKLNKSYYDPKTKKIFWTIKLIFLDLNINHIFSKIEFDDEENSLDTILKYLYEHKTEISNGEILKIINETNNNLLNKYEIYLKKNTNQLSLEEKQKFLYYNKYYYEKCNTNILLKDLLKENDIYEYPEFYLISNPGKNQINK